jgi:peroxiredoxin
LRNKKTNPNKKRKSLTFKVLLDENGEISDEYRVMTIPTSFIIDSNGSISY